MSASLRASSVLCLARRALPYAYYSLGMVGILSVFFAILQRMGFFFWQTHAGQTTGFFYSPVAQGGFLGLLIVAMVRLWCFWPIPIFALGLAINPNRGGWVCAGVGLLATWIRWPLLILATVLIGAFFITLHPGISDQERLNIWQAAIVNLHWFGNGWGSFDYVWIVRDGLGYQAQHAHNDYLELAFELGLYAIPIFCVLGYALSQSESPDWPILVAFCVLATFTMPSFIPATATIGALALTSILTGVDNG